jgi:2-C-methyl-D-erythritol 4-phosphate cytidylyltransferase
MSVAEQCFYAVVPAAGVGKRVAADKPKQYIRIAGLSIIEHTLTRLLQANVFTEIVVAVSAEDDYWQALPIFNDEKIRVVEGGKERSDSVLAALKTLAVNDDDWVLVHDVARPCIKSETIHALINTLKDDAVGGILALPLSDTVKQVAENNGIEKNCIERTLDRSQLWGAQTPQMFRYQLLVQGLEHGLAKGLAVTDEASAIELLGLTPKVVEGLASNIKVTRPEDIKLAEFYLQQH